MGRGLRLNIALCLLVIFGLIPRAEGRQVRIGIGALSVNQTPFYIAKEKGYYQKEGLEVDLVLMRAPIANMSLIAGEVEFSAVPTAGILAALRGAPLRILFTTFSRPLFWLHARPEIRKVEDLRGKKVGSSGASADATILKEILSMHGLEGGRDVPILNMGDSAGRLVSLDTGVIDASVFILPWNLKAEEAGYRALVSLTNQNLVLLGGSIVARENLIKSDPALIEKFVRATYKGFLYAKDNRSGTIPILARHIKIKDDLAAKSYDLAKPAMTRDGTIDGESQKSALELVKKAEGIKEPSPVSRSLFDFSFTQKIQGELKTNGWKPEN